MRNDKLARRFWSKVQRSAPDECWPWLSARHKYGYGCFRIGQKWHRASRVAWELERGQKPAPLAVVMHICDNPPCCNPAHLRLTTQLENIRDMAAKGRRVDQIGSKHGRTHLSDDDILAIRAKPFRRGLLVELSNQFNIAPNTVGDIYWRRTWKHL